MVMPVCSPVVGGGVTVCPAAQTGRDLEAGPARGGGLGPLLFSPEWVGEAASPEWGA